jgi:hypothetical protein
VNASSMCAQETVTTTGSILISKAARECLEIAAITGTIVAAGGGYWVSSQTTEPQRRELVKGLRTSSTPIPNVGTRTIYACEALGLLRRGDGQRHKTQRTLTEQGWLALAGARKRLHQPMEPVTMAPIAEYHERQIAEARGEAPPAAGVDRVTAGKNLG